ncbi:DUF1761 domain-containing protein [bacterium]|nr:DUF1761 domain-containing protein [bacterium]
MTHPQIVLNWKLIFLAMVAAFIFGFLWYGPLFGKIWGKAMGYNMNRKPKQSEMMKGLSLQVVILFLTTFVLAHLTQVWRPSVWGVGKDFPDFTYGFSAGFFTWLGFYVPHQLSKIAWEMRSWKVFLINTAHDFIVLQILAQILSCTR